MTHVSLSGLSQDYYAKNSIKILTLTPNYQYSLSTELEAKESPLWWQQKGLSYTASGYGKKIPTSKMVRYKGKWRRVYCCIFSNSGTCYIGKLSDNLIITN